MSKLNIQQHYKNFIQEQRESRRIKEREEEKTPHNIIANYSNFRSSFHNKHEHCKKSFSNVGFQNWLKHSPIAVSFQACYSSTIYSHTHNQQRFCAMDHAKRTTSLNSNCAQNWSTQVISAPFMDLRIQRNSSMDLMYSQGQLVLLHFLREAYISVP